MWTRPLALNYRRWILGVPDYYKRLHMRHWSQTKARCSMAYLVAEYMYRQPRYYRAKRAVANGDASALQTLDHYDKPSTFPLVVGSAMHTAAFAVANGADEREVFRDMMSSLQEHKPVPWIDRDEKQTDYLLSDDGDRISLTLKHAVAGIREAFPGANQIDAEEEFYAELPGIEIPVLGYSDGRGGGVIGELKTHWDNVRANTSSGFAIKSLPAKPPYQDIIQIGLYRRHFGGQAKLIYANRIGHRVFEVDEETCEQAVEELTSVLRKRQSIFQRCDGVSELLQLVEPDWSDFRWRDYRPELMMELKTLISGGWDL